MNCSLCSSPLAASAHRCASCGAWQWGAGSATAPLAAPVEEQTVLYEDVSSADKNRYKTGLLDDVLGGGIVYSDLVLLGGGPGAGKSTLMIQVANVFCRYGEVLYVAGEEDIRTIKARGQRLGIDPRNRLRFLNALSGTASIGEIIFARRPKFVILDSIDSLSGHNNAEEIQLLLALKKFCVELQSPAIVISQVNKAGEYAGLNEKKHAVDVLMTFDVTDETDEDGEAYRELSCEKNRSGRAFQRSVFRMTSSGLMLVSPDELEEDEGPAFDETEMGAEE